MNDHFLPKIISFIQEIGIEISVTELKNEETFVPGIHINKGKIMYDPAKMLYPGDLLHEAGHIAVMAPEERHLHSGDVKADCESDIMGDEVAAILWSFAAAKAIELPLEVVFHPDGYRGASPWFIESFQNKVYMGLPLLVWMGFTHDVHPSVPEENQFPKMITWLRP